VCERDQFAQPFFQLLVFFAQRKQLPLAQRDRPSSVRVRQADLCQHVDMLLEELRVVPQILCDVLSLHCHSL